MTKELLMNVLKEDENGGNGEIVFQDEDTIQYSDYHDSIDIKFRLESACIDSKIAKLIHISTHLNLSAEYVIAVLKKAFGVDYYNAVCTLSAIIIPTNEKEFEEMLQICSQEGEDLTEFYSYPGDSLVGIMYHAHQIVFIHAACIKRIAEEIASGNKYEIRSEFECGILTTLIHEMRHLMFVNPFLCGDKYKGQESEESVEEFSLRAYEMLGELKHFPINSKEKNNEIQNL